VLWLGCVYIITRPAENMETFQEVFLPSMLELSVSIQTAHVQPKQHLHFLDPFSTMGKSFRVASMIADASLGNKSGTKVAH
jgi:hypothetical protein